MTEKLRLADIWDAAPEMVVAIRLAIQALERGNVDALPALRAALAKAEGR